MFSHFFKRNDGDEFEIRAHRDEQGEPWFVAADVCKALELHTGRALARLDADEKGVRSTQTPGGAQSLAVVSEPGLYRLILGSRKPEAKEFKRWVTHEVLPSIRKTGSYETADPLAAFPDYLRDAFTRMAEENKALKVENTGLKDEVKELAPMAEAFQSFADSDGTASLRDVARLLNVGERGFGALVREWGWVEKLGTAATAYARDHELMVNKVIAAKYGARPLQGRFTAKGFTAAARRVFA
ncbi:BRO family protein [Streptomyces sp. NPDC001118]|uniref:BRO family protein n=1 Tax=Streptomyces sp. NPDC001127 TaxID=3154377 RepID=UPI0033270CFB